MDAENALLWEAAIARVVTVEVELRTAERRERLTTDVVCYEGYFARPWNFKYGGPTTGFEARSTGYEALEAELPTGASLFVGMRGLCRKALLMDMDIEELPKEIGFTTVKVVAPELLLYCPSPRGYMDQRLTLVYTDALTVSLPEIVALEEWPLRTVVARADLISDDRGWSSESFRRWGDELSKSHWKDGEGCWSDRVGQCSEELTNYCGANPR